MAQKSLDKYEISWLPAGANRYAEIRTEAVRADNAKDPVRKVVPVGATCTDVRVLKLSGRWAILTVPYVAKRSRTSLKPKK